MKSPLISIVIPSYNKVKYISETLDSIINQSYRNIEIIIQDGRSTDGTIEIIKKYATKYPSLIKYESKKDGGQLTAINTGLKKTKGEIVTFINADDVYAEGAFESVIGHFTENPEALWFAGKGIVINDKGTEIAKLATLYKNFLLSLNTIHCLLITNYLIQPSVFLTKKAIQKYGTFTGTKFSVMEYDLWLKVGKDQMPIVINKVLSRFRLSKDTKTSLNAKKILEDDEEIIKVYTKNILILWVHKFHNLIRMIYDKLY